MQVAGEGDWTVRGRDLDQRFARFGHEALNEGEIWALSMASMVLPSGHPGCAGYLSRIAGTTEYADELKIWGRIVALGISSAPYKARNGSRRRLYVEGFVWAWGRLAVADGLTLAMFGQSAESLRERSNTLKVGEQAYSRIRDFVGNALVDCIAEYKWALGWALGHHRDRVLEGRWEGVTGLKWGDRFLHETMGWDGGNFPLFASGCVRVAGPLDSDSRLKPRNGKEAQDPETQYRGLAPSQAWDAVEATRIAPVITFKPCHGILRLATDG